MCFNQIEDLKIYEELWRFVKHLEKPEEPQKGQEKPRKSTKIHQEELEEEKR